MPLGASEAIVNKKSKLMKEKRLVGFDAAGHSGIHIQTAQVNPFYALEIRYPH
jgi:hypothetical protein